jgi:RNA polymerase sigma-70 factor (ECF subfamily)
LLLSPIVSPRFPWKEKEYQYLRHDSAKRTMNSADQFEAMVGEHYEPLFRFAMSLTRSESDAWDLTQQTFYVWATKGHQLRDLSKAKSWLFTTLHRAYLVARRRQTRFPHDDLEEVSEQLPALFPALADQVDSTHVLPALAQVDEVYQAAVALFYLDNCSYRDIAAILEVPVGTVKSRIARGIAQLRDILLSSGSRASSPGEDRISSVPMMDESAAPPENGAPAPRRPPQFAAADFEGGYAEWDLSSTLLWEPLGLL